jgi:hypothetical protein
MAVKDRLKSLDRDGIVVCERRRELGGLLVGTVGKAGVI